MFGRRCLSAAVILGALFVAATATPASACPMCKMANESGQKEAENLKPKAYMYSILFMLAMPATLLTGFGIGFYRLARKQQAVDPTSDDAPSATVDPADESDRASGI